MSESAGAADPFAHLHDEDYLGPFGRGRVGHADLVITAGREAISLDGDWRFTLDLFDEGLRQKWYLDEPDPPESWTVPRDYDCGADRTIAVPSCWTCARPEWRYFEGGAWYTRFIDWAPAPDERVVLRIGAANYEARVFLNGAFVASHRGGFTPFCVELTGKLRSGANRLQVNVDSRRAADRVPMHHFDWFNDGGIFREVALFRLPQVFIRDAALRLAPDAGFGAIKAEIALSDAVDGTASVRIPELGVDAAVPIVGGSGSATLAARPELWSPQSPRLYDVEVGFGADRVRERIGFRDIRVAGMEILLNGAPIVLQGVCVHEDDVATGRATSEADIRRRLAHAKELGCNALRLAHYPHHDLVARLADEAGLMLWAEVPVYWAIDFANPATYADAENQLLELIRRDRNRASVVIWGVGNENADTDARYRFMSSLAEAARRADPSRLVAAACLINRATFRIEDRLAAHLDLIGLNEYFGWYEPEFTGLERLLANSAPDRPVVISEFGADALAGHRGGARTLFSEDAQAAFFRRQFEILSTVPWIKGAFPWVLYDFRSERRQTRFQKGFNRKGLIAEDKRTKKAAFEAIRALYSANAPPLGGGSR
ncbi:MAG: glycoside hydrolase family 2 [Alphaproteobacteria bacterium]|nr:glycoside hydrolase family 2 [Alphaproteobacteria bacterium]